MSKSSRALKYEVRLSAEERVFLESIASTGRGPAARMRKARILLKADVSEAGPGWNDGRIAEALETSPSTVFRVRQSLVEKGLEVALSRKRRETPPKPPIFDGEAEARLIQ